MDIRCSSSYTKTVYLLQTKIMYFIQRIKKAKGCTVCNKLFIGSNDVSCKY